MDVPPDEITWIRWQRGILRDGPDAVHRTREYDRRAKVPEPGDAVRHTGLRAGPHRLDPIPHHTQSAGIRRDRYGIRHGRDPGNKPGADRKIPGSSSYRPCVRTG